MNLIMTFQKSYLTLLVSLFFGMRLKASASYFEHVRCSNEENRTKAANIYNFPNTKNGIHVQHVNQNGRKQL